ncbi:6613_t:CDS:2 [Racocetra fulgida]|uniref:6613_t:CDS:1 n=1 Tax=Racocetra fulgida TaxID=60492 RepID=A0A9N9DCC8_9GLOM|nr:6613_t:CDS:2 [Racocetra fulgida]
MIFEHNETAYGQNLRGFDAFVPDAFDPRFPISPATLAGAAAYKAVKLHEENYHLTGLNPRQNHNYAINLIRESAANEANLLLQRFPLPGIDPMIVVVSAEAGAHRLYDHENFL